MAITNTIASVTSFIRGHIKDLEKKDGRKVFEYIGDDVFTIPDPFVNSSSIVVYLNGTELDSGDWSFNSDRNQVTLDIQTSGVSTSEGDIILITWFYYKKWSDDEIKSYIKSALGYFVKHRYKKTFEVDADDEIIAINDLDPTENELYFIALISAILIDPQNITINTPEFSMGRNREESDEKQIAKAFMTFRHFAGTFSFNILEDDC